MFGGSLKTQWQREEVGPLSRPTDLRQTVASFLKDFRLSKPLLQEELLPELQRGPFQGSHVPSGPRSLKRAKILSRSCWQGLDKPKGPSMGQEAFRLGADVRTIEKPGLCVLAQVPPQ